MTTKTELGCMRIGVNKNHKTVNWDIVKITKIKVKNKTKEMNLKVDITVSTTTALERANAP